ncbi:MAG: DsbA family protein [Gemmatimonadota bacterium]
MTPVLDIEYYTDPLCCWSWALAPAGRRLRYEFGDQISWRYRLGGMIADWSGFSDPLNGVDSAAQMGPYWYQMRVEHQVLVDERIWAEDPPASSYPASVACKAAERQGPEQGERYLRRVREAVTLERRNVARREVLLELAAELADAGGLDREQFERDLGTEAVLWSFRDDVKEARYRGIGRFPSLVVHPARGPSRLLVGFRPYEVLREQVVQLAPGIASVRTAGCIGAYVRYWGRVLVPEVAAAFDMKSGEAKQALDQAAASGTLVRGGGAGREWYEKPAPCDCSEEAPPAQIRAAV